MCLPCGGSHVGFELWRPSPTSCLFVCSPQETYNYYYLPFCKPNVPGKPKHKWGGLGEVLQGNELIDSQLEVKFRSQCCICCQHVKAATGWQLHLPGSVPCGLPT